jgi:amino acid permease
MIGILGYLTFGNLVQSNIVGMYPHSLFVTWGQLAIAILVLLSYPLQCHPCRASLDKVLSCGVGPVVGMSKKRHTLLTVGILIASYVLAIAIKNLSTVLSLVGATGSTTICYILPGLFYFKYRDKTDTPYDKPWDSMKVGSLVLAGCGVLIMSSSLTAQLHSLFQGNPSSIGH